MMIRIALEQDLAEIVDIYNSTIPSRLVTADLEPVSVENRRAWFLAHDSQRRPLWVLTAPDKNGNANVCGWMSLSDFYGRPAYQSTAELSIYLAPSSRGKGLGEQLLKYGLDEAPRYGVKTILGFIFGHNQPSLSLFAKFGFEQWARLPNVAELDGIERDLIIVGKRIDTHGANAS